MHLSVFQNHPSRSFQVRRDIPKGSIVGLVVFSLFINNLPTSLPSSTSCSLYVADLAIWSSSPSVPALSEAIKRGLTRLERWDEPCCLPLNQSKAFIFPVNPAKVIFITTCSRPTPFYASLPLQLFLGSPLTTIFPFLNMYLR